MDELTERERWPAGNGEMARRIREHDWAATPLGPIRIWPQSLRTIVDLMLGSQVSMVAPWGPQRILLYNDAYRRLIGPRGPTALGHPVFDALPDLREILEPHLAEASAGRTVRLSEQLYPFVRTAALEDAWFDITHTPVRGEDGRIAGVLSIIDEKTERVLSERRRENAEAALQESEERQAFLLKLSDALRPLADPIEIQGAAVRLLGDWLRATRAYYVEYEPKERVATVARDYVADGVPSLAGRYGYDTYRTVLERIADGRTWIVDDVTANQELSHEEREILASQGVVSWIDVPLIKQGTLVAILCVVQGAARQWTAAEAALVEEVAERTWAAVERARAEHAKLDVEGRYWTLFDTMDEGFCIIEKVETAPGEPIDFRYVEGNPSFTTQTGVSDVIGRTMRDAFPEEGPEAYERYEHVVRTGESVRFEYRMVQDGRVLALHAFRVEDRPNQVAVIFQDITEQKRAETALRESEARQAFLLKLNDALRPITDPVEVMAMASEALGRHMEAGRCGYGEVDATGEFFIVERDWTDGVMASFKGKHRLVDFGPEFTAAYRAGRTVLIDDALADARAKGAEAAFEAAGGVRASLGVPMIKAGRFVAGLYVQQVPPRRWTAEEEALARQVADRTWAAVERARAEAALREAEERYLALFNAIEQGFATLEVAFDENDRALDYRFLEVSPSFAAQTGIENGVGRWMREISPDQDEHWFEIYGRVALTGEPVRFENYSTPLGRWWAVYAFRIGDPELRTIAVLFHDITDRKRAEQVLRDSEERQAFLLRLSDALRPLTDPVAVQVEAMRVLIEQIGMQRAQFWEPDPHDHDYFLSAGVYAPGATPLPRRLRPNDFGRFVLATLFAGQNIVIDDTQADTRLDAAEREAHASAGIGACIGIPLRKGGRFVAGLGVYHPVPHVWTEQEIALAAEVAERTWDAVERTRVEAALRESDTRLQQFGAASSDVLWIRDAETLRWEYLTPAFESIYGIDPFQALEPDNADRWTDFILDEDRDHVLEQIRRVAAGERVTFEYRIRRLSDGEIRWLRDTDFPLMDYTGRVQRIGGIGQDITEEKDTADRLQVLVGELQHRTRNLMTVVRSVVDKTRREAGSFDDFGDVLRERLDSLSRAQSLLSRRAGGEKVTFDELLKAELAAHTPLDEADSRVTLDGPTGIRLPSTSVQTLTLAIHELTTNAVKYGALSQPQGRLSVRWQVEPNGAPDVPLLFIDWHEQGVVIGGTASPGKGGGYGRELIERALPYQLKATTTYEIGPEGVHCTISLPVAANGQENSRQT